MKHRKSAKRLLGALLSLAMLLGMLPAGVSADGGGSSDSEREILLSYDFEEEDSECDLCYYNGIYYKKSWRREYDSAGNHSFVSHDTVGKGDNCFDTPRIQLPNYDDIILSFNVKAEGPENYEGNLKLYITVYASDKEDEDDKEQILIREYNFSDGDGSEHYRNYQINLGEWAKKCVKLTFRNTRVEGSPEGLTLHIDDILITSPEKMKVINGESVDDSDIFLQYSLSDGRTMHFKLNNDIYDRLCFRLNNGNTYYYYFSNMIKPGMRVLIDLNGHTFTRRADSDNGKAMFYVAGGELTIMDSRGGGAIVDETGHTAVIVDRGGKLTIEDGVTIKVAEDAPRAVCVYGGNTVINGGTFIGGYTGLYISFYDYYGKVIVNGGVYTGDIYGIEAFSIYDDSVRIRNAVSYSPVRFSTSRSILTSDIDPNTIVNAYDKKGRILETYTDMTDFQVTGAEQVIELEGDKITFTTKDPVDYIGISCEAPIPGEAAEIPDFTVNNGTSKISACLWRDENGRLLSAGDRFEENMTYTLLVQFSAGEDGRFYENLVVRFNGERVPFHVMNRQRNLLLVSYTFPPTESLTLDGEVQFTTGAHPGEPIDFVINGLPSILDTSLLRFQWQYKDKDTWKNIPGSAALEKNYVPTADLLGKEIRFVTLPVPKFSGTIVSGSLTVTKKINSATPEAPILSVLKDIGTGKYTTLRVANLRANQDYVYTTSEASDLSAVWTTGTKITSVDTPNLKPDTTYYVYTRMKETDSAEAGADVEYSSIVTTDQGYLKKVILGEYNSLGDGSNNTIFIPLNGSVTLEIAADPLNAKKWSNIKFMSPVSTDLFTLGTEKVSQIDAPSGNMPGKLTINAGSKTGTGTLGAYYTGSYGVQYDYGHWTIVVYDPVNVTTAKVMNSPHYGDITLNVGDSSTPDARDLSDVLIPAEANKQYTMKWQVIAEKVRTVYGTDYIYGSENEYIKVDPITGKVTAKKSNAGAQDWTQTVALIFIKDGYDRLEAASYKVVVNDAVIPVESVSVYPEAVKLAPGANKTLTAIITPTNTTVADTLKWSKISGSGNITVNSATGEVTVSGKASSGETAVIQAKYGDKTGTCVVTVEADTFSVTVVDGEAYNGFEKITSAKVGTPVSIIADAAPENKKFDKWVVVSGEAILSDADSSSTSFIMPSGSVKIKATYKDIPADEHIINITAADVTAAKPVNGNAPTAAKPTGAGYIVANTAWEPVPDGKFAAGTAYSAVITLEAEEGYQFTSGTTFKVNGSTAKTVTLSANQVRISFTFPATEGETPYSLPFTDVQTSAWYYESVRGAHKLGLINGKTETLYIPESSMTYAEAIKLAACMHQLYNDGKVTLANGSPYWYSSYFEYCRDNGIIPDKSNAFEPGYDDLLKLADKTITRAGYALLFSRALPDEALAEKNIIPDDSIPDVGMTMSVYDQAIYKLYRAGIVNGRDGYGTFSPDSSIQRSEVAAILIRMMDPSARVDAPAELGK